MCFEPTARPPEPPRTGALAGSERLTLQASDGNAFAATFGQTSAENAPAVVVLPDIRGLHPYYEALAEAFADAGVNALAVDLYGRTAGASHRDEAFEWKPHRAAATDAGVLADVRVALDELYRRGAAHVYVLGFCFGGRAAFMSGTLDGVNGVVGFYGWPAREEEGGSSPVAEARAGRLKAPVLALYGGADEGIKPEDAQAFAKALDAAGTPQESVVYDGAPHSFFDRSMAEHRQACDDAWFRVLRFMGVPPS
jgi:carboxymethylenebutenolidase